MSLKQYKVKRNFKITNEPLGKVKKKSIKEQKIFVMHKHAASHLHYDLRLEDEGVLKSWAIPKGPSLDPHSKRLAVQVEDHPLEYAKFEGLIPKGEYGGGAVLLWDKGTWEKIDDKNKTLKNGNFTFMLSGEKLKGKWKLVQIKKSNKDWLLIKVDDKEARPESDYDILKEMPFSVLSKKAINEITFNHNDTKLDKLLSSLKLKKAKIPEKIFPELGTLVKVPPKGDNWIHEIKFDGYRLICHITNKVKLMTRGQKNWTQKFPALRDDISNIKATNTILDGEVVALDKKGCSNFSMLQHAITDKKTKQLIYYVFDVLYCQGYDLTNLELQKRKEILKEILSEQPLKYVRLSEYVIGSGEDFYQSVCKLSFEGMISKVIYSKYHQSRTKEWAKVKCINRQEFVIGGYTYPKGSRKYFGSLMLGFFSNGKFIYCGQVGTGFNHRSQQDLYNKLQKYKTNINPFDNETDIKKGASWIKPKMVIEVEFTEWTNDNKLRHPSYKSLRIDKSPNEVIREVKLNNHFKNSAREQLILTHPDKIIYPKNKITKNQVAEYYYKISKWILPFIMYRPLSLVRCPQGVDHKCFYQKHLRQHNNIDQIYKDAFIRKNKKIDYLYIKNIKGLLQLAQMGVLEIHPWGCKIDKLDKPDMIIFDLDPGDNVKWETVVNAAFSIKSELQKIGLITFLKVTGGKGLHIVIPIVRRYSWEAIALFSKTFVQYMARKYPHYFIDSVSKNKRWDKIFIDHLRNRFGATAVASYSLRAREAATVAIPIGWNELSPKIKSDTFTMLSLFDRLLNLKRDPWQGFSSLKQKIPF